MAGLDRELAGPISEIAASSQPPRHGPASGYELKYKKQLLKGSRTMKMKILEEVLSQRPVGPLYHYTDQAGLLGIIRGKQIWATHTQYLNDTREFLHAVQMMREELTVSRAAHGDENVRDVLEAMDKDLPEPQVSSDEERAALREMWESVRDGAELGGINVCVASFSEIRDSLSQWRAYVPRGGFCIGVRGDRLADLVVAHKFYLAACLYDRGRQQRLVHALIEEVLEENIKRRRQPDAEQHFLPRGGNMRAYLNRYAPILKDPSFAEEREWRIISRPQMCTGSRFDFREGNSMLIPFYRFPLHHEGGPVPLEEVVVGPTPDPERSAASVRNFLVSQGLEEVKVTCSAVPYRNW